MQDTLSGGPTLVLNEGFYPAVLRCSENLPREFNVCRARDTPVDERPPVADVLEGQETCFELCWYRQIRVIGLQWYTGTFRI